MLLTVDLVRMEGLEPPRLAAADFESAVATITPHPLRILWRELMESNHLLLITAGTVFKTASRPSGLTPCLTGLHCYHRFNDF